MNEFWMKARELKEQASAATKYAELAPTTLVGLLAYKSHRNPAIVALVGALNADDMKKVRLSEAALEALADGLKHPNSNVRWWCLQLFDHTGDERAWPHVTAALEDPEPRVRAMAQHALECEKCKSDAARSEQPR